MKNQKRFMLGMFTMLLFASLQVAVFGQEAKVANVRTEGMGVRFDSAIPYSSATLTISAPDGTVYRRESSPAPFPPPPPFYTPAAPFANGHSTYHLQSP